ncbi:arginyltransferase [Rhodoferax sp. 4810]|uniref:Aspartate/glutamate leucyltransferase n=1 Tax=Thiospirillum jenense TaxID=1653858 RepID=A0A839HCU8_9GAMM|nr:arginyltransferase [Thiospirillum jenense]MBB1073483.1 arginyltransferase [Rhodoferax jenense]MBB1125970.1 arginyltransferase [Thiospirillum jenense]
MTSEPPINHALQLYLTDDHPCSYLDQQRARTLFVDPLAEINTERAQWLQEIGFRRSGSHFYRPSCRPHQCQQCRAVRLPVAQFQPNRSQRRAAKRNQDLRCIQRSPQFDAEHYALYSRYVLTRHSDGDMADDVSTDAYERFLLTAWGGDTWLLELREGERLVAVAVTDVLSDGLSAVYTFFDPAESSRALGTAAILAQITEAQQLGVTHLYLGYWIANSRKMAYKQQYRPLEIWDGAQWRRFEGGQAIDLDKYE